MRYTALSPTAGAANAAKGCALMIAAAVALGLSSANAGVTVDRDIGCVNDFLIQNCPSYFKRDYVHLMFKKPKT